MYMCVIAPPPLIHNVFDDRDMKARCQFLRIRSKVVLGQFYGHVVVLIAHLSLHCVFVRTRTGPSHPYVDVRYPSAEAMAEDLESWLKEKCI